ncbi:PEP-CTERM/exosortase system-associated acyltransferase [Alkalilimnicola ehrlichii MLHE-1]|uniref:PEP-CTERM/exosortase system-associated acyltransferase n=1 Tax=Alkalilimnicola ehrlichii (strain ATCC BAA-1101 / DSM 17681 / MLHE-1) TaxID=187272 RepID=Q0ACD2_ALKEH|nr:PEP-CTERM/exosortase system-associated acyltransferase [Alkalilimnicola ehrlichii]ABI55505.1 hypothetical protein Mlg_0150 [Alkalilimnicola ehrlichii MLHE-1]
MSDAPLAEAFEAYFDYSLARGDEQEEIHRLRYDVYCREFGFEREEDCPGGLEQDEFDALSWHGLLRHRGTGRAAGCVRVVPADAGAPGAALPIEKHCGESFFHPELRPDLLEREHVCEVSRLAVHGVFRRRRGESKTPLGDVDGLEIPAEHYRTFPLMAVSLFMAATALTGLTGKHHVFAMMEPRLARLLSRSGLVFVQVGDVLDYHGLRAAFYIHRDNAVRELKQSAMLNRLYQRALEQLGEGFYATTTA